MKDLNKVADKITSLYDNRFETGDTAEGIYKLVVKLINESKEYTLQEKAELERFNIDCFEACK